MQMMRKGQVQGAKRGDSLRQAAFIVELFGVAISMQEQNSGAPFLVFLFVFAAQPLISYARPYCASYSHENAGVHSTSIPYSVSHGWA